MLNRELLFFLLAGIYGIAHMSFRKRPIEGTGSDAPKTTDLPVDLIWSCHSSFVVVMVSLLDYFRGT